MKIRTQSAEQYLEYEEAFVRPCGDNGRVAVYLRNYLHPQGILAGMYENMGRAKGVLYEMNRAYQEAKKVFYMPIE